MMGMEPIVRVTPQTQDGWDCPAHSENAFLYIDIMAGQHPACLAAAFGAGTGGSRGERSDTTTIESVTVCPTDPVGRVNEQGEKTT